MRFVCNAQSQIQTFRLVEGNWTPVLVAPVILFEPFVWFHLQRPTARLSLSARFLAHGCCWLSNVRCPTSPVAARPALSVSPRRRYEEPIGNLKNEITGGPIARRKRGPSILIERIFNNFPLALAPPV